MSKGRIEIFVVRIEGVKSPEKLSCHINLYNKLYDVLAPLTRNNKENKLLVPFGVIVAFQIKTLEKNPKTLFTTIFNTQILVQQSHFWLPLYPTPQEITVIPHDVQGPKLFLTLKNSDEEVTSCTPELSITPELWSQVPKEREKEKEKEKKDLKDFYEEMIHIKDQEIQSLQQEISQLKQTKSIDHILEISNKIIDPVEILLNIYLSKSKLEGLIVKHKGNLYKYGSSFVEIALKENKLCCRTESNWNLIEDFILMHCKKELELLFENRPVQSSCNTSPMRLKKREKLESEDPAHRRSESFKRLIRPTTSVLSRSSRQVNYSRTGFRN